MRVPVTYIGPHDEVEFEEFGLLRTCARGDVVLVDADVAGHPSTSIVDVAGRKVCLEAGAGLLAQEDNWRSAEPAAGGVLSGPVVALVGDGSPESFIPHTSNDEELSQ